MESVIELKSRLDDHQLSILSSEMEKFKKSTGLTYVLWFFLGSLGIHKFYIGKGLMGVLYLVFGLIGWITLAMTLIPAAIVFLSIVGILLLIDLFTIPRQIRKAYENNEIKVINNILGQ